MERIENYSDLIYKTKNISGEYGLSSLDSQIRSVENLLNDSDNKIDFMNTLNALKDHLANYSYSFCKRLNDNIQKALGIEISTEDIEFEEDEIIPDISIIRAFNIRFELLWFLFPMFIFRNVIKNKFINQINSEVETNLHRLTSDLTERVNRKIDSAANQTLQYI